MLLAQLNPPQLVSLTHFSGRPAQRWACPAAPAAAPTTAGRLAAAPTASWGTAGRQPAHLRHSTAVQLLRGGRQHPRSLQHSRERQRRGGLQITAAAGVLQPPIAGETLTQLAARFMGYAVLLGSCFRSTPQIARIMKANSARGVSLVASLAELVAYSITCAYNLRLGYAFSTYGEVAACWVQDIILVALISRHMRTGHKRLAVGSAGFAVYCWWLTSRFCSISTLTVLQASTISMVALGGRLPQIVLNIRRGDSGELSITTSALNLAGNLARAFTTVVLTHDALLLLANAVQACLNAVLLYQTAMTAVRRRQHRRRLGDTADLDAASDDEDAPEALSPAALEAAEEDAEADNDGSASAAASSVALAEAADSALGDGGFGSAGGSAMLMEPPPSDFMDLAGGGGGGGGGQGTGDF